MKKENGITLIALVLVIVIIGLVIFSAIKYAQGYLANQSNEDTKAEMLAIQTIIKNIKNKHTVNETENVLVGTVLDLENNTTGYNITDDLKQKLLEQGNANFYILSKEDLQNNGINNVEVNENEFYIVDYNSSEIFYSLGINGNYKLSEM